MSARCVVLRSDQCFSSNAAAIVTGCKNTRKADGTCLVLTKTQCLESDAAVAVVAGTKQRDETNGNCVTLAATTCLDTGASPAAAATVSTAAPFVYFKNADNTCTKLQTDECYDSTAKAILN